MKRMLLAVISIAALATGCKQGLGERCQVRDDCAPPLICNMATQTCADMAGGDIDASIPDAPPDQ